MLAQPIKPTTNISLSSKNSTPNTFPTLPSKPKTLKFKVLCCSPSPTPTPNPPPSSSSSPIQAVISILQIIPDWADSIKERGFRQNRTVYDHEKWVHHRSSYRHLRHFLTSLSSRVILSLIPPVIAFTLVAVVIASYNSAVSLNWLPGFLPVLRSSSLPYQLTAPALALLLVFRTEASYSRFEEGRKAWTKVIAGANDFASEIISGVENSGDAQLKKTLLQYIVAFPVALKVGVLIEEPFPMLALDDLCNSVQSNVREALASKKLIQSRLATKGKIQPEQLFLNG